MKPRNDDAHTERGKAERPEREQRSYRHGSGDRNVWSPLGKGKERMPMHEGGTQRHAPPEPDTKDG